MTEILRPDLKAIADLIPAGARVLDIGCGTGTLLAHLQSEKKIDVHGMDIDGEKVSATLARGLSAVQGDADRDLKYYPDNAFDYVILGETLQATQHPKDVLNEILRISKKAVVSIPNFGYWKNRAYLSLRGRMPVTSKLSYQWYETPNIHFCTIRDFVFLAEELGCTIEQRLWLGLDGKARPFKGRGCLANLLSPEGLFVLSK